MQHTHGTPTGLRTVLSWIATLLIPVAIVLTAVRMMFSPLFLQFEYNTPNFPDDPFGFTKEERLYWSNIAVDYLLNDAGIEFLGDLRFEDGTPVYNARELRHMLDVKITVQNSFRVWWASLALLGVLGLWAWRSDWFDDYRIGAQRGGKLTVLLLGLVILFVLFGFGVLFVAFHNVFFQPGTWMFLYSDTLIRLFPERFWRDIFIIVGGLSVLGGLGLWLGLKRR